MDHFEYVMVLISIIIGLGIAHILLGVGGIVDRLTGRGAPLKLSLAHAAWLAHVFIWLVMFWWWEFRLDEFWTEWTIGHYSFLVMYSVMLFFIAVILIPRSWEGVADLDEFFVQRRAWFYSAFLAGILLDVVDSYLKGGLDYILVTTGAWTWSYWLATSAVCLVGIRLQSLRFHTVAGVALMAWLFASGFFTLPTLGF